MLQMGEEACSFSLSRKLSSKWNFPDTRGTWKLFDEEKNAIALLPEEASISTWRDFLALTFFSFNWQLLSHLFLFRFFLAFHLFSLLVLSVFCFTFRYTWHETTTIKINTRAKTSFANPFVYRAKLVAFSVFPTDWLQLWSLLTWKGIDGSCPARMFFECSSQFLFFSRRLKCFLGAKNVLVILLFVIGSKQSLYIVY